MPRERELVVADEHVQNTLARVSTIDYHGIDAYTIWFEGRSVTGGGSLMILDAHHARGLANALNAAAAELDPEGVLVAVPFSEREAAGDE